MLSLFQRVSNFNDVKDQYMSIAQLTKKMYLIGGRELAAGINGHQIQKLLIAQVLVWKRIGDY